MKHIFFTGKTWRTVGLALGLLLLAGGGQAVAQAGKLPVVGDRAPLVQGLNQDGKEWRLADLIGKRVVLLYFYPKNDTPGCTKEACGFRDRLGDLKKQDVEVVGVSFDTPQSHREFIAKYQLNFSLVADADGRIADAYGARMLDKNRARRVSFLIGKDGKVLHVTDSSSADVHLQEMQAAVAKLGR